MSRAGWGRSGGLTVSRRAAPLSDSFTAGCAPCRAASGGPESGRARSSCNRSVP
ncbi:Hypothetical Protein RSKD131_4496 (plasmid) [Cereibacter sphaeroides KD131]|nr:Hypothetical Protein RSKD131_4496 [Cereibacter sphaeroides KD131]